MNRYVLGVHSGHDSSACLICNDKIVCAIEKERLTRKKHDSGEPIECIEYLLEAQGLTYSDIDLVVRVNWFNSTETNDKYYENFKNVIVRYEHHLFHAYAVSIAMSEHGIIYVIDGRGCRPVDNGEDDYSERFETESVYYYDGSDICLKEKIYEEHYANAYVWGSHMNSIGYIYADVSRLIFQDYNAAGKIMALASFGRENESVPDVLQYNGQSLCVSNKWLDFLNSQEYPLDFDSQIAKDISYSLQRAVEEYFQERVNGLMKKYDSKVLALTGGVALNCKNNGELNRKCKLNNLFLFPACGDNGIAVGAAVWGVRKYYNDNSKITWNYDLGKSYGDVCGDTDGIKYVTSLLHKGEIIGLYENGSEFGPRALCNRSILALPSIPGIKGKLNAEIKRREWFRPFGGVVLERNLTKITDEKVPNKYMLIAVRAKKEFASLYPELIHIDNTVRIQVVGDDREDSSIYKILDYLERNYGEFVLINTSFNGKGEPIVETPQEAKNTAANIGIKYILLNGRVERVDK